MTQTADFFDTRAQESAFEASEAKLDRVRERALRSEAAWRQMADRARLIEKERAKAAEARMALPLAERVEGRTWT